MILPNPTSNFNIEMAKHEQFPSEWTIGGLKPGNPYAYREYPRMIYQARQVPGNGKWATSVPEPEYYGFRDENEWGRACAAAQAFAKSCQRIVNSEREYDKARAEGWRDTPGEAVEHALARDKEISDLAANRNFNDRNMSEKAKAESAAVEAETFGHVAAIPEKPKAKRGRPFTKKQTETPA